MVILVIAPHPDDEVLGCGGVIARHASRGDQVFVLVVTRGIPELFPPDEIERTRNELRAAHMVLGVAEVEFLDFPAPQLDVVPCHEVADEIRRVIGSVQPTVLYLPHGGDIHADHRAVYNASMVAARPTHSPCVRRVLCYETLSETEWASPGINDVFIPTVYVDISRWIERKLEAVACYQTQLREPPHPRSLVCVEALARWRGGTAGVQAAEAFMLVREIVG